MKTFEIKKEVKQLLRDKFPSVLFKLSVKAGEALVSVPENSFHGVCDSVRNSTPAKFILSDTTFRNATGARSSLGSAELKIKYGEIKIYFLSNY